MIVTNGAIAIAHKIGELGSNYDYTGTDGETVRTNITLKTLRPKVLVNNSGIIMELGSGTTPLTVNDIDLDSPIDESKYHCISAGGSQSVANVVVSESGELIYTYVFSIDDSIEVNELSLVYFTSTGDKVMLARKVIPTRTAEYGDVISFTYTLKCNGD